LPNFGITGLTTPLIISGAQFISDHGKSAVTSTLETAACAEAGLKAGSKKKAKRKARGEYTGRRKYPIMVSKRIRINPYDECNSLGPAQARPYGPIIA